MLGVGSKLTQRKKKSSSKCPGYITAPVSEWEDVSDYIYSDIGFPSARTCAPAPYFFSGLLFSHKVPA